MTPMEAAQAFFEACGKKDWDEVESSARRCLRNQELSWRAENSESWKAVPINGVLRLVHSLRNQVGKGGINR